MFGFLVQILKNNLIVAIKAGHVSKSVSKRDRELRRLKYSINYDAKDGSGEKDILKGRGPLFGHEA